MDVRGDEEGENVGDDDYNDDIVDVDGATYADADDLWFFSITTDVGDRLWGGGVDTGCVTVIDG